MSDDILREFERKENALNRLLEILQDNCDDRISSKNGMIADNETAWERGRFESKDAAAPLWTEEMMEGFIIRTRRDALHAKLNTIDMLDRTIDMADRIRKTEKTVRRLGIGLGVAAGGLLGFAIQNLPWW